MEASFKSYEYLASINRLTAILDQSDLSYEEKDQLPNRDKLTFSNGFYANCAAIFIDIRESSKLPQKYKRPKLARLYRAFISECVAIMNGDLDCREINVVGDGVWSVVNTPLKSDIDGVFSTGYTLASMVDILNCRSSKRGFDPISVGIGMGWGRALMIKAGYSGSGLNDVVYVGDVVNRAAHLASFGNQSWGDKEIMVGNDFRGNLNEDNQKLLSYNYDRGCYHGNVVRKDMDAWLRENCS